MQKIRRKCRKFWGQRSVHDFFSGNVKLIHVVRNGMDVVTSRHPNWKDTTRNWVTKERWKDDVSEGLTYKDISLMVKYEDLVTNPEETLRTVCDYIDIEFDKDLLNYSESTNFQADPAWEGKAQRIHTKSVGKWELEEHKDVIDAFREDDDAMAIMEELGYL